MFIFSFYFLPLWQPNGFIYCFMLHYIVKWCIINFWSFTINTISARMGSILDAWATNPFICVHVFHFAKWKVIYQANMAFDKQLLKLMAVAGNQSVCIKKTELSGVLMISSLQATINSIIELILWFVHGAFQVYKIMSKIMCNDAARDFSYIYFNCNWHFVYVSHIAMKYRYREISLGSFLVLSENKVRWLTLFHNQSLFASLFWCSRWRMRWMHKNRFWHCRFMPSKRHSVVYIID